MRKPTVTLTTDFGTRDHFVGVLKGVIRSICPDAVIVDISHEIPPFDIAEGAYAIAQAYKYFPPGTSHVVVVDPGVGSPRRAVLVEAAGHHFIGPDNGVLASVYSDLPHTAREIVADKYFLRPISRTFHGRDVFAPVAAHLSNGVSASSFGPVVEDHSRPIPIRPTLIDASTWLGRILHVDRFGNLITNYAIAEFNALLNLSFTLAISTKTVSRRAVTYAEVENTDPFLIGGSSGYFEIATNRDSAARMLGCGAGTPCELKISA